MVAVIPVVVCVPIVAGYHATAVILLLLSFLLLLVCLLLLASLVFFEYPWCCWRSCCAFHPAVAGASGIAGVPSVAGVPAIAAILSAFPADPGVLILAGSLHTLKAVNREDKRSRR
jgi:hypothetical protein